MTSGKLLSPPLYDAVSVTGCRPRLASVKRLVEKIAPDVE